MQNFNQIFQGVFYWTLSFGKMNQSHYIYLFLFYPFMFRSIILFTIFYSIISLILFQFISFFGSTINLYLISTLNATQHLKFCQQYFGQISSKLIHFKSYYESIINWLIIREDLLHTKLPYMFCAILIFFRFFIDFFNFQYFIRDFECVMNDSGLKVELSYFGYL